MIKSKEKHLATFNSKIILFMNNGNCTLFKKTIFGKNNNIVNKTNPTDST